MHPSRFFIFAVIFFCALGKVYAQLGGYPGIDPDHIPKDPFQKDYYQVDDCHLPLGKKSVNLSEPGMNHESAFELINLTPTGRKLLAKFRAENKISPFNIVQMTYSVRRERGFPARTGAAYNYEGKERTLFYDPEYDLGLQAIFLSHELVHATDPEVPSSYHQEVEAQKNLPRDEYLKIRYANSFRLERKAFSMQDKILPELMKLAPCYANFLQQHRDKGGLKLYLPTPDDYIYDAYGIPRP